MQLVGAGKLRLDDRLGTFIPWLPSRPASVAIRKVLNHAAGIVRDGDDCDFWQFDRTFPDAGELRCLVERAGDVLPANNRFKYSNLGSPNGHSRADVPYKASDLICNCTPRRL